MINISKLHDCMQILRCSAHKLSSFRISDSRKLKDRHDSKVDIIQGGPLSTAKILPIICNNLETVRVREKV